MRQLEKSLIVLSSPYFCGFRGDSWIRAGQKLGVLSLLEGDTKTALSGAEKAFVSE